jgi:hypothetical protein
MTDVASIVCLALATGYGAKYAKEYTEKTVGLGAMNVAEFWPEAAWEAGG